MSRIDAQAPAPPATPATGDTMTRTLYRAADSDIIVGSASFAADIETARAYLNNPGFGGRALYVTEVEMDEDAVLDLYNLTAEKAIEAIMERADLSHPGAIGADEWAPRVSYELRDAGVEWVRVRESYPQDAETWIFVGDDDPDMVAL
jgi:hypothetical protein